MKIWLFLFISSVCFCQPIELYVQRDLHIERSQIKKNSTQDLIEGGKIADIFFVTDLDQSEEYVIKRHDKKSGYSKEYEKEVSAYQFLNKHRFRYFKIPKLFQSTEDDEYLYLTLSKIQGSSLNQLLKKRKTLSKEQKIAYDKTLKIFMEKCGCAFYELHHSSPNSPFIYRIEPRPIEKKIESIHGLSKKKGGILLKIHQILSRKLTDHPITYGTTHGDLHPGNLFFDEKTENLTLIDFSTLSGYLQKKPRMAIPEELAYFISHFEMIASLHGFDDQEIEDLVNHFKNHYPNSEEIGDQIDYFRLIYLIEMMETCQNGSSDKIINQQMKKIFSYSKRKSISFH